MLVHDGPYKYVVFDNEHQMEANMHLYNWEYVVCYGNYMNALKLKD